jgi:hypothetical protein
MVGVTLGHGYAGAPGFLHLFTKLDNKITTRRCCPHSIQMETRRGESYAIRGNVFHWSYDSLNEKVVVMFLVDKRQNLDFGFNFM